MCPQLKTMPVVRKGGIVVLHFPIGRKGTNLLGQGACIRRVMDEGFYFHVRKKPLANSVIHQLIL